MITNATRLSLDELLPQVYEDLRRFASSALRHERNNHALQTTALVHEAYVRLAGLKQIDWENRDDVLRTAVGVMRRVLIDFARARNADKRDSGRLMQVSPVSGFQNSVPGPSIDILAIDEALEKLRAHDQRKSEIVELRYFGGQNVESVARLLDISVATVKRDWSFAKAWLFRELYEDKYKRQTKTQNAPA